MKGQASSDLAFDDIYKTLWPKVYKFIFYRVENKEIAEELTQEVFRKVYPHFINNKLDDDKVKAYIYTTARNVLRDVWRKKGDFQVVDIDSVKEKNLKYLKHKKIEEAIVVRDVLDNLKEDERKVLIYRIVEGYTIKEVSKMLSKPQGTIKSMQYRSLKKLRKMLMKGGFFNE